MLLAVEGCVGLERAEGCAAQPSLFRAGYPRLATDFGPTRANIADTLVSVWLIRVFV